MKIIVNHLTRMQPGLMCVAGIDPATGRHVRPVPNGLFRTRHLACHGGPFELACVVDIGRARPIGQPPETEDFSFRIPNAVRVRDVPPDEFWQLLTKLAQPSLTGIFGKGLKPRGPRSCALDQNTGPASLGCLAVRERPRLSIRRRAGRRPQVRMDYRDDEFDLDLSVTDIRLYGPDHVTPDEAIIERTGQRLESARNVILSVGLTRAFSRDESRPALHWLQVNNVHFEEDPCWR